MGASDIARTVERRMFRCFTEAWLRQIAMEFMNGGALTGPLAKYQFTEDDIARVMKQVCARVAPPVSVRCMHQR